MKLTPLVGAYQTGTVVPELSSIKSTGQSGASNSISNNDPSSDIGFVSMLVTSTGGEGYGRTSYGHHNAHGFIDPDNLDEAIQLRWQDVVQFDITVGTDAWATLGFLRYQGRTPDDTLGIGWMTDDSGYWVSFVRDYVRYEPPPRTLRYLTHLTLDASDPHALAIVLDGKTRTIYWIADGDIVDFFTLDEGLGALSLLPQLEYRVLVDNSHAGKLRFHGGGDPYILALGEAEALDTLAIITQPVLTVEEIGYNWVELSSSVFIHSEDEVHLASKWQITLDADTTFASPVIDDGWDCSQLLRFLTVGTLLPEIDYRARVRYIGEDGTISDWSDAVQFTTLAEGTEPSTPWSNTGAICQPGETEPDTPWEKPSC